MKVETIYNWNVKEEIKKGGTVYFCDRVKQDTGIVNHIGFENVIKMLDDDTDRYDYWELVAEEPAPYYEAEKTEETEEPSETTDEKAEDKDEDKDEDKFAFLDEV